MLRKLVNYVCTKTGQFSVIQFGQVLAIILLFYLNTDTDGLLAHRKRVSKMAAYIAECSLDGDSRHQNTLKKN